MAWLFQRPDSERWWVGYRVNGKLLRKSTKTSDKEKAKTELAKVEAMLALQATGTLTREFYETISGTRLPTKTLKAGVESWLANAEGTTQDRTFQKYQGIADELLRHFNASDNGPMLSDITKDQLREFLIAKRNRTSSSTANNVRTIVGGFMRFCEGSGFLRENPMRGVARLKESREETRVRRPFTLAELQSLYKVAPNDFWRYMLLAGFFTGLRMGDLATMPIGAVDWKSKVIRIRTRKTGRTMQIPIADPLYQFLRKLKVERKDAKPADAFFPNMADRYEESNSGWFSQRFHDLLLVKAGLANRKPHRKKKNAKSHKDTRKVSEVSFHCLRYSYVSTLAALGQNQQVVKVLAGHSSDEISDLYTSIPVSVLTESIGLLPDITAKPQEES